jgi:hypothetical protein
LLSNYRELAVDVAMIVYGEVDRQSYIKGFRAQIPLRALIEAKGIFAAVTNKLRGAPLRALGAHNTNFSRIDFNALSERTRVASAVATRRGPNAPAGLAKVLRGLWCDAWPEPIKRTFGLLSVGARLAWTATEVLERNHLAREIRPLPENMQRKAQQDAAATMQANPTVTTTAAPPTAPASTTVPSASTQMRQVTSNLP